MGVVDLNKNINWIKIIEGNGKGEQNVELLYDLCKLADIKKRMDNK